MATLQSVARQRKADLRQILKESRKVDAAQERLEREVKRLATRKNAVPEMADAERLLQMTMDVDNQLASFAKVVTSLSQAWKSF